MDRNPAVEVGYNLVNKTRSRKPDSFSCVSTGDVTVDVTVDSPSVFERADNLHDTEILKVDAEITTI